MLKNLVGLVTGGASGLGKGAAKVLIHEGCKVTIADLPNSPGREVAASLGPEASFAPTDVRSAEEVERTLEDIMRRYNRLDFVVNCAGISCAHKIYTSFSKKSIDMEKVGNVIDTNLIGVINVMRLAPRYISQNVPDGNGLTGAIVNTAGIEAFDGQPGQSIIAATSGGIVSMTNPVSKDLSSIGIRVNCICVGVIDTPLVEGMPHNIKSHISQCCTLPKRLGMPEEFGHAVKFALENRYLNGSVVRLDAGLKHFFA